MDKEYVINLYTKEYYLTINRMRMPFAATQMDLEILLIEGSQTEKGKDYLTYR